MFYSIFINSCNIGYVSLSCVKLRPIIIITIIIIIKEDNKALSLISLTRLFNVICDGQRRYSMKTCHLLTGKY